QIERPYRLVIKRKRDRRRRRQGSGLLAVDAPQHPAQLALRQIDIARRLVLQRRVLQRANKGADQSVVVGDIITDAKIGNGKGYGHLPLPKRKGGTEAPPLNQSTM